MMIRTLTLLTLLLCPLASASPLDLRVPSAAAGTDGELAVRIFYPDSARCRYDGKAAVVVVVPGGSDAGTLANDAATRALVREGLIVVKFLFPGGSYIDPALGATISSDGTYDYRGTRSMMALRDVVRYCLGSLPDDTGATITGRLPQAQLSNVGLLALSNGGNIAFSTMARHGAAMSGLAWYGGWENPSNGQTCVGDLGTRNEDPDPAADGDGNGIATDDGTNPYYTGYGRRTFSLDLSNLAYDPTRSTIVKGAVFGGLAFHDGNGNGRLDLPLDRNGNGRIDVGEDFPLSGYAADLGGGTRLYYSEPVRAALDAGGFPLTADVASLTDTRSFWSVRELATTFPSVATHFPNLRAITGFSRSDHVQAAHRGDGHLHIQQLYDGLAAFSLWRRANPDRAYLALIYGRSGGAVPAGAVDNPANVAIASGAIHGMAQPSGVNSSFLMAAAAVELADRTFAGDWSANLSSVLVTHP